MKNILLSTAACVVLTASLPAGADVPANLVVDLRVYEARSSTPDFLLLQNLSFYINTDGSDVTEAQWLATIARQVPETFLAVLASETLPVTDGGASFRYELRSRGLELELDLSGFEPTGSFEAAVEGRLTGAEGELASLTRELKLRLGQTHVFSGPGLELSPSDYLSHFREYEDLDHRGRVYEYLRDYAVFIVLAITPRLSPSEGVEEIVSVSLPDDVELPELVSPAGVPLVGRIVLEFEVEEDGSPLAPRVVRSTLPEVTPVILAEVEGWRFPEAAGSRARLELALRTGS